MSDSSRIDGLEEEVAHLRRTNEELSEELLVHLKKITKLEARLEAVEGRIGAFEAQVEGAVENVKPPHW
jgi:uncharacterized coiled-coil protein SlyX